MANKYVRDITETFHTNNRTKIKRAALCESSNYISLTETPDSTGKIVIKNKQVGIYLINIGTKSYLLNIKETLTGNDQFVIENKDTVYTIINGIKRYTSIYRAVFPAHYSKEPVISNTVFDNIDTIAISGETILGNNPPPYKPTTINSISSFDITTSNSDETKNNVLTINLKNNIKKLPNGIADLFIMDSVEKQAYIIHRIGRIILTGLELWYTVEENTRYCIYSTVLPSVNIGEDDRSINCNYFPTMTYTNMMTNYDQKYGISNCNNRDTPGFYIRIPTELINKPGVENFKKFLKTAFKTNPVIIEYLLSNIEYKSVLLDEYCVPLFYPETKIKISNGMICFCFYKALNYDDNDDTNRTVLQFNL